MNEEDDLLHPPSVAPPRLDHPAGIEGETPGAAVGGEGEESVSPRKGDGGRVESVEVEDEVEEDSRLGFLDSGEAAGVHGGRRMEDGVVGAVAVGGFPQFETLEGAKDGILGAEGEEVNAVGTVIHGMDCSHAVAVEEDSGTEAGGVGAREVGEGKDVFVGGGEEVVTNAPPVEAVEEEEEAKGAESEPASYPLPELSASSPMEKEDVVKGGHKAHHVDVHLGDEDPVLVGSNEEVRTSSPLSEAGEEVGVEIVEGLGAMEVDVNVGEAESVLLRDMDESQVGISVSAPVNEEEMLDVYGSQQVGLSVVDDKVMLEEIPPHSDVKKGTTGGEVETKMVETETMTYGSQQVKLPIVDDKVMLEEIPPNSYVREGTAGGEVETKMLEIKTMMIHDMDDPQLLGSPVTHREEEDAAALAPVSVGDKDAMVEDVAVAEEKELSTDMSVRGGGRKKRGRPPRVQASKAQSKKKVEEDVCFICFDGGDLVVCDRRGCPKVYHASCVNRDEAFFRAKGRWNCGWHICSICEKSAKFMCYTCTHSLCKGCVRESDFVCVRGNKGLCGTCRSTVMLIETNEQANKTTVNFDDKSSWEFLFKDYWFDLKSKLSITLDEVTQAKNPSKRSLVPNDQSSDEIYEANGAAASSSDSSSGRRVRSRSVKKRAKRKSRAANNGETSVNIMDSVGSSIPGDSEWASKDLLEFVSHMRGGDASVSSQFDVQALLLEYIKRNNLRDPRRKSQIICDSRLESLFGKARVGHFEMLKLLESHFLIKEASHAAVDDNQGATGDPDGGQVDLEGSSDAVTKNSDKRRKARKKEERGQQNNFSDYAAVDVHNINLVYLRRNLMEDLIDDVENFHQKVVGAFVRIRISGTGQKQDMYRVVQVVGTTKTSEKYKTGKKTTDIALEILNLNKTEVIPIDSISNQEFTEEECKRLRQSIKCGLIRPMTVGDLQEKAVALQAIRVIDWLESEKLRLGHLRDRASEKGRRKELRECVEKLQLLNTPEERTRRLNETLEIHADPNMDPAHESAEEEESYDRKRDNYSRPRDSGSARKGRELMTSGKSLASNDSWNAGRGASSATLEPGRNAARDAYNYAGDRIHELVETPTNASRAANALSNSHTVAGPGQSAGPAAISTLTTASTGTGISTASSINEAEKIWHYQDPSGKVQGPFSMVQLRKWNSTGYFPLDLKIWKTSENQEDSILLTDALIGKFQKEMPKAAIGVDKFMSVQSDTAFSSSSNWDLAKDFSSTSGLNQAPCNPFSAVPYPGKSAYHPNDQQPSSISGESWKIQVPNDSLRNSENNSYNLPTPTPKPNTGVWGGGHGMDNKLAAGQPLPARWDGNPSQGVNASQSSPAAFEPNQGEMKSSFDVSTYQSLVCPTPTPNNEQSSSFPVHSEQQKSFALSISQNERGTDTAAVSMNELISNKIPVSGDEMRQSQIQTPSGDRKSSVTTNRIEWSMPSPTPGTGSFGLGASAKVSQVHNPASTQWQTNPSAETVPQTTADQPMVSRVHQDAGTTQNNSNTGWGAVQGNKTINWGMLAQGNASLGWVNPAQGSTNVNTGWSQAAQVNPTASTIWRALGQGNTNTNSSWGTAIQGNPNSNPGWGAAVPANANLNTNWAAPAQGYSNVNHGWVAPAQENVGQNGSWAASVQVNANTNAGWGTPAQGNPNVNTGYGTGNGNINTGWNPSIGNNSNSQGPHHRENRDRHSSHGDRGFQGKEYGHGGGRQRMQPSGGVPSRPPEGGQRGVCKYHESGRCRRGSSCNFLHT